VTWKPSGQATHAVTGVVDPTNAVAESDEADNKTQQTVTLR
jgi:subtilase family serine protease